MSNPEDISIVGEIDRLATRLPFLPFSIVMASGREYDVNGEVNVATGRSTVFLFVDTGSFYVLHGAQVSELVCDREGF